MSGTRRRAAVAAMFTGFCLVAGAGCMPLLRPIPADTGFPPSIAESKAPPTNANGAPIGGLGVDGKTAAPPERLPKELQQTAFSSPEVKRGDGEPGRFDGRAPLTYPGPVTSGTAAPPCGAATTPPALPSPGPIPSELNRVSLPPYTIAPPDIITIDAVRLVPRPPYRVEPLEVLLINVPEANLIKKTEPISGPYIVSPEGTVSLGYSYGSVRVAGLTLEEIQAAIQKHLGQILTDPQVTVALPQIRGFQQIRGEHLVRPDGTIGLGTYGSVYVAGMTLDQAKVVVERHLSAFMLNPQVGIDVFAYNSKFYYVIIDGGGFGQQVFRLSITGNETVLDAISMVQGLAPVSSKHRIWLARPSPVHVGCNQILPIDWNAITQGGSTPTNYQLFPGDRIYVSANCLIKFDNYLSQVLAPIERILGVTLLGAETAQSLRNTNSRAILVP